MFNITNKGKIMNILLVDNKYQDIIVTSTPCILNNGVLLIPIDCESILIELNIPYRTMIITNN